MHVYTYMYSANNSNYLVFRAKKKKNYSFPGSSDSTELPAMKETWVGYLGWEDPPEKGMATHSSILAWRIPWTEEPDRLQSMGLQRIRHD